MKKSLEATWLEKWNIVFLDKEGKKLSSLLEKLKKLMQNMPIPIKNKLIWKKQRLLDENLSENIGNHNYGNPKN